MFHRFAHLKEVKVKEGDIVKKGEIIGTIGSTGNSTSAHLHWDISHENQGLGYVNGWTKEKVQEVFIKPEYEKNIPINFSHIGWGWLDWYGEGYHPGIDLNGPGSGNSDLGNTIYSPVDGEVIFVYSGGGYNSGWGNLISIKENQMENHIVENILSRAKKYLGIDAGTRINKAEDEKIGDAIKELANKKEEQDKTIKMFEEVLEETRDELIKSQNMLKTLEASFNVQFADKQTQINYQTDMLVKRAEEYEALLKDYAEVQNKLDRLEAVQGRDVENTKAMDALRFFIKTLFKKNE